MIKKIMHSVSAIAVVVLLDFGAKAQAREPVTNHTVDVQDLMDESVDKLVERLGMVWPNRHVNLSDTTLEKPSHRPYSLRAQQQRVNSQLYHRSTGYDFVASVPVAHVPGLVAHGIGAPVSAKYQKSPYRLQRPKSTATRAATLEEAAPAEEAPSHKRQQPKEQEQASPRKSHYEWFNPMIKFGPVAGSRGEDAPLLLFVPGTDGSGLTPAMQFPELASAFEIKCLSFKGKDRSTFAEIKASVKARVREAKARGREVYLMGESFGGIVVLSLGMDNSEPDAMPDRIVLVNAASCFDRTPLGRLSEWIIRLPEPFFSLAWLPAVFMLFDNGMFGNIAEGVSKTLAGKDIEVPRILDAEDRQAFVKRVFPKILEKMRLRSDDLRWRLKEWLLPGCKEVNPRLKDVQVPVLAVAGTADLLLPSLEEALKFEREIADCTVRLVEGAGHAGVLDHRADLLKMIQSCWAPSPATSPLVLANLSIT